ncbi:xylose operon transcription regulator XylR [Blastopirellula marina]|uniref:AraC family transcriptional regulator n=1 Tax=Blastopirellula marina TaxID=124 RepID=A0A2S8F7L9_9BACT|nr:DNA-binding transcriptional regulator [Blastopirellula marina]PQO28143.1 AraC family transcriptional regulator [Blastopirellula marina]PTL41683.1 AraC family transcriptional regulator [Blastopirellula marina]
MPSKRSVAVLVETYDSWGRDIVESIARYAQTAQWALVISPRDEDGRLRLPPKWRGDGVIAMLRDQAMVDHLRKAKLPLVDVDALVPDIKGVGRVVTDDKLRVAMAFEHFRSKNFRHFATYAPQVNRYPDRRSKMFREVVEAAGFPCFDFHETCGASFGWSADSAKVAAWIRQQTAPLAVFAPDPVPARQLTEICQWEGIRVPDEVGILAGDTDDLLCTIALPPISSIELDCFRIGREACVLLDKMINGKAPPKQPVLIPPLRVIPRHSTEILAVSDLEVAEALRFIRSRACDPIQVNDILEAIPISRRSLEQRFRNLLGRSIGDEIRRVRFESARQLLVETNLSTAAIAGKCGFSSGVEMAHAFRKYYGIRPSDLRKR